MDIHIALSQAEVECLRRHLPDGTDLRQKLDDSEHPTEQPGGLSNAVACSEGEARALLHIAIEHCFEAVEKIQHGMRLVGVRCT